MAELDLKTLDNRLVQRYLRKGLLDQKQYDEYLKTLPDVADQAASVEAAFEPSEAPQLGNAAQPESGDNEA
ncbi:MAG TPA: hypothetical protein VFK85_16560 [Anaeromyxobacteraceae bacterium]|nr:hypothetical protein [Anaeromyxobacteraceae bacterium]